MDTSRLTLDHFLSRFQLLRPQMTHETLNQRQAAVLIPVVRRPQPGLLLTQRAIHLRKHAGQVAFPGGAVDSTDASLIAAALREAQEEVAIPPQAVEVIGVLPPTTQRQITYVAKGDINSTSTDAVTGAQIYSLSQSVADRLGGGA
ncbi:CoA pyrophosphatase, partial [Salmonella enterica subsp. enterica serovar Anatum]|nr:CoA pyrophosphatase [Salmonella enterica subsp. enterica serovar Anatum]